MKRARIRSFFGPYFSALGLNMERFSPECAKLRTRKTPNMDTFHTVLFSRVVQFKEYFFTKIQNTNTKYTKYKFKMQIQNIITKYKFETKYEYLKILKILILKAHSLASLGLFFNLTPIINKTFIRFISLSVFIVSKALFETMQREMKCTFKGFFFNREFRVFRTGRVKKIPMTSSDYPSKVDSMLSFNVPMNEKYCFALQVTKKE